MLVGQGTSGTMSIEKEASGAMLIGQGNSGKMSIGK